MLDEGDDEQVTVDMGSTRFEPSALPFDTAGLASRQQGQDTLWALELDVPAGLPRSVEVSAVAFPTRTRCRWSTMWTPSPSA